MDTAKVAEAVVRDLSRHRGRNDIVMDFCHSTGMDWKQAEAFVSQVEQSNQQTIARRQAPLLMVLAGIAIVGGFSTILAMADATVRGTAIYLPYLLIPYAGNAVYFGLGVLGVAGGLFGLVTLLRQLRQ